MVSQTTLRQAHGTWERFVRFLDKPPDRPNAPSFNRLHVHRSARFAPSSPIARHSLARSQTRRSASRSHPITFRPFGLSPSRPLSR